MLRQLYYIYSEKARKTPHLQKKEQPVDQLLFQEKVFFTMFLKGTSLVGPARGNMLGCVEPLMATVCSAVFLDTVFLPMDIIGFGFIIATVFILAKS